MRYLYLDESGDLGHDMTKAGTSRYLVITILEVTSYKAKKAIEKAVFRAVKNKLQKDFSSKKRNRLMELKASNVSFSVKKYFYRQITTIPLSLYSVVLDKERYTKELQLSKSRVYNFITHLVLKGIPLEESTSEVVLIVDKSKNKQEIREFDEYLFTHLESSIPPQVSLLINHNYSHENKLLQAVDLFAWGLFRKYEVGDKEWYDVFKERIKYERIYPPIK